MSDSHKSGDTGVVQRQRLVKLLDYIEEAQKLRGRQTFDISAEGFAAWQSDIRALPGVFLDLLKDGDHIWMKVERVTETAPPPATEALSHWLLVSKDPKISPHLREAVIYPDRNPPTMMLRDLDETERDQIHTEWRDYQEKWNIWAQTETPRRKTISLYSKLFSLQRELSSEGAATPIELVWGTGVAVWKVKESKGVIRYPLITKLVEVTLNSENLSIEVRPRDAKPRVELDPFAELGNTGIKSVQDAANAYFSAQKLTYSPFDGGSYEPILRAGVTHLDPNGSYLPDTVRPEDTRVLPEPRENLVVSDTWVLFSRNRGANFLIDDLHRLKESVLSSMLLPAGPLSLVTEPSSELPDHNEIFFRGVSYGAGGSSRGGEIRELYFPKPYNDEQVSIVAKLETGAGIVAQGPPGTGKTHTIANVICHYLAQGKRVLVTSKGEPALAVLRDQIPEEIRPLAVSLLTSERDGMKQFEHAIQKIASEISRINPASLEREIESNRQRIDQLHSLLASTDREIEHWAKLHLTPIEFQGQTVLPERLAKHVLEEEAKHQWLEDELDLSEKFDPTFNDSDIVALREARQSLGTDIIYLDADLPCADELPDGKQLLELHRNITTCRKIEHALDSGDMPSLLDNSMATIERASELLNYVKQALELLGRVKDIRADWPSRLREAYRQEEPGVAALETLLPDLEGLTADYLPFVEKPVDLPAAAMDDEEFVAAVRRSADGGPAFGFFFFLRAKAAKHWFAEVRISGNKPQEAADWVHVDSYIDFVTRFRAVGSRWNAAARETNLPSIELTSVSEVNALNAYRRNVEVVRQLADLDTRLPKMIANVFVSVPGHNGHCQNQESLVGLHDILARHLQRNVLLGSSSQHDGIRTKLAGKKGLVFDDLRAFLEDVGEAAANEAQLQQRWLNLLAEVRRLSGLRRHFECIARVTGAIEKSGAPKWARLCATEPVTGVLDLWTPADWLGAWTWRRFRSYLDSIDGRDELVKLQAQRGTLESDLGTAYRRLVEAKTWHAVYKGSTPAVKSALQSYLGAIAHIGKGTGIRAVRHRLDARNAMQDAHTAVPCWIMPHWRVSESLPADIGAFDLIIIDEASQSDLWALPSMLRGKKILVVGDDKQVSPDAIGLEEKKIIDLKSRFLEEQVFQAEMTPEKSIYDLAKVVFAGNHVMLTEHFRCVEPIISFSNKTFYNSEIRPLRIPKSSERLDPPLIDVFIKGGFREGDLNKPEAQAIVNEIKAICEDPALQGRTIGVISLTGLDQAKYIDERIKREVDAREIVNRHIECGDARTFQGKERHIMLLSMVAAPSKAVALTQRVYEQRFNVAASRAKDRMYLFRSVELSHLNPDDLRAKLISHFAQPLAMPDHEVAKMRDRCESEFERDMFDGLTKLGYRVLSQVRVGAYRIDLVVEGTEDRRLAIECDGDKYHGPERWAEDMKRQRILERAGWKFWRCFASTFFLHNEEVVRDLLGLLKGMGIDPVGASNGLSTLYVEHRIIDPKEQAFESSNQDKPPPEAQLQAEQVPTANVNEESSSPPLLTQPNTKVILDPPADTLDQQIFSFCRTHGIRYVDNRPKGGALWVDCFERGVPIASQLMKWGFRYSEGKGYWLK